MRPVLLLLAPLLLPAPASAIQAAAEAPAKVAKPKRICRSVQVTGRRIGSSVCHSAEEWAAIDAANQEAARQFTNDVLRNGARNGGRGADGGGGASLSTPGGL